MESDADVGKEVPTDDALEGIAALVREQQQLEQAAEEAKKLLDDTMRELRVVSEKKIPEAMQAIGLASITTNDGHEVTIKEDVYASIRKDNTEAAYKWLRDMGFDDIIKNNIVVSFGRGQDEDAVRLGERLDDFGVSWTQKETVHGGTLKAFIKEQLKLGNDLPLETFGAYIFQKAIIK
jgi:hypothetical protein